MLSLEHERHKIDLGGWSNHKHGRTYMFFPLFFWEPRVHQSWQFQDNFQENLGNQVAREANCRWRLACSFAMLYEEADNNKGPCKKRHQSYKEGPSVTDWFTKSITPSNYKSIMIYPP